jgi:2,4-dienoyl-CoA reductase-like NADH-dependent reductase (Old Yellow Enzyme family)
MDQNSCDDGAITDLNIAHYEARARGGVGLLILETSAVAWPIGATSLHQPALSDDRFIPGLSRLADAVHHHFTGAWTLFYRSPVRAPQSFD